MKDRMRNNVKLINDQLIYGFILEKDVTFNKFKDYLKSNLAEDWTVPILWKEFKEYWKINT